MLASPRLPRRPAPSLTQAVWSFWALLLDTLQSLPLGQPRRTRNRRPRPLAWRTAAVRLRLLCWKGLVAGTDLPDLCVDRVGRIRLRREGRVATRGELIQCLNRYRHQIWQQRAIAIAARSAVLALIVLTLGAALYVFRGVGDGLLAAWPLALFVLAIGLIVALAHHVSLMEAARIADRKLEARARIATALELEQSGASGPFVAAQREQTLARVRRFDPKDVVPLHAPWGDMKVFCISGVLLLGLSLLNVAGLGAVDPQQRQIEQTIQQQAQKIDELRKQLSTTNPRTPNDPQAQAARQQVAATLDRLARDLRELKGSPAEALSRLTEAERELMERARDLNYSDAALERLAQSLSDMALTQQAAEAMRAGRTDQAAADLNQLANDLDKLSEQSRQDLVGRLRDAAQQMGRQPSGLRDAAQRASDALANRSNGDAAQALKDLAREIQRQGRQAASQEAIGRGLSQIQEAERAIREASGEQPGSDATQPGPAEGGSANGDYDYQMDLESMAGQGTGAGAGAAYPDFDGMGMYPDDEWDDHPRRATEKGGAGEPELPSDLSALGVGGRLNVDGRPIEADLNPSGEGSGSGRFTLAPADISSGSVSVSRIATGNSADTIVTSPDANSVPWDLRNYIRDYFSQLNSR